ncbi:MAG: helix-turn-helix transcriptional regulator [Nitrospira sp.]|nr:helix-turn-helix transcriptional regulator [Nitrospira sp.]
MTISVQQIPHDLTLVVRTLRAARGLTQYKLGRRAKLPQTTISMVERGVYRPTLSEWAKIWNALTSE